MNPERLMQLVQLGDDEIVGLDRDAARLQSALENLRDVLERKKRILEAQLEAVLEILVATRLALESELSVEPEAAASLEERDAR